MKRIIILLMGALVFGGCATRTTNAPIVNVTAANGALQSTPVAATPATTTTASATSDSAKLGSLTDTQVVAENGANTQAASTKSANSTANSNTTTQAAPERRAKINSSASAWFMPVENAKVITPFSPQSKGVDFALSVGFPVYAVQAGKVVYSGNGLKGYGNLIIIKHANNYLSAYAHNQNNLVKEKTMVKKGQKIATVGNGDDGSGLLHFEIRKDGKPIDPMPLLNSSDSEE